MTPGVEPSERTSLAGKVALITAAAGAGIGQAIVWRLANAGADIILTDIHERRTQELATQVQGTTGRRVLPVSLDVASEDSVAAAFERGRNELGPIDILVNNSGIGHVAPVWELDLASWQRVLDVNLTGTFLTTRAALPSMIERGASVIVNISSIAGSTPWAAGPEGVYAASKVA